MKTTGLLLAAGLSRRMGEFKPLMRFEGKTLLECSIDSMLEGGAESVVVVLGYRAEEVQAVLRGAYGPERLRLAYNSAYETTDMLASIKIGIRALPPLDAFLLLPGDMPAVGRDTFHALQEVMRKTGAKVVFPTVEGHRKHPPLISGACARDILSYIGGGGLRGMWQNYAGEIAEVAVTDEGCLMDADTMDDFRRLTDYLHKRKYGGFPA